MGDQSGLSTIRDYWGSYHHHKEQMAFAAATLYLGGATALLFKADSPWPRNVPNPLIVTVLVLSAILAFVFVGWQLKNREIAAGIVEACSCLIASGGTVPVVEGGADRWRNVPLPPGIVQKLAVLERSSDFLAEPKKARAITMGAMGLWTLAALVALICGHAA